MCSHLYIALIGPIVNVIQSVLEEEEEGICR